MARTLQSKAAEVTLRWNPRWSMGLLLATASCGSGEGTAAAPEAPGDFTGTDDDTDSATPPVSTTADTGADLEPAWWSLDAELVVAGGVIDPATSTWQVSLWGQDATELPCQFEIPIETADTEDEFAVDAGTLVGWWQLSLGVGPDVPTCPAWIPEQTKVGIGPYDVRLDAATHAHGWLGLDLYGLYLQLDPAEPVLVVGVAGTEEQFLGEAGAVDGPPLPDGAYTVTTLLLLAL